MANTKFKVGDRVRSIAPMSCTYDSIGTVVSVRHGYTYAYEVEYDHGEVLDWDDGMEWFMAEEELELVS